MFINRLILLKETHYSNLRLPAKSVLMQLKNVGIFFSATTPFGTVIAVLCGNENAAHLKRACKPISGLVFAATGNFTAKTGNRTGKNRKFLKTK